MGWHGEAVHSVEQPGHQLRGQSVGDQQETVAECPCERVGIRPRFRGGRDTKRADDNCAETDVETVSPSHSRARLHVRERAVFERASAWVSVCVGRCCVPLAVVCVRGALVVFVSVCLFEDLSVCV